MTGGPRVLIAPGGPGLVVEAVERAAQFGEPGGPAPQFLMAGLEGPLTDGDYVGATVTAQRDHSRWASATAARLSVDGAATADSVVLQSPEPHADMGALAIEWASPDAVVGDDADAATLKRAGIWVHRVTRTG